MIEKTYTTKEAALELGVSVRRVQAMVKSGRLKATKFGRDWEIGQQDLDAVRDRKAGQAGWQSKP